MNKAIVIGGEHHNTLGVIRSLGRRGVYIFVIITSGCKKSNVLNSKYVKDGLIVNGSEAALAYIRDNFDNEIDKPVLFACHDKISSLFDLNRDELSKKYIVPGSSESGLLTKLMNKWTMADEGNKVGFNIPKQYIVDLDTIKSCYEYIEFPVITKPIASKDGSKTEINVFNNLEELKTFLRMNSERRYIVQRYVIKEFEYQLIGVSLNGGQEIIIPGVSQLIRTPKTTNTGFLLYKPLDDSYNDIIAKVKSFIQNAKYSGLFSLEFLREEGTSKDYFMEMNFRNDGNTISVANAGVNLPYIWYLYCIGKPYNEEIKPIHLEYVMPEFTELQMYVDGLITKDTFDSDMKKASSYMDYADDDPTPTLGWSRFNNEKRLMVIKHILKKLKKQLK